MEGEVQRIRDQQGRVTGGHEDGALKPKEKHAAKIDQGDVGEALIRKVRAIELAKESQIEPAEQEQLNPKNAS